MKNDIDNIYNQEKYTLDLIKKSKEAIKLDISTDKLKSEMTDKLLSCFEISNKSNTDNLKIINEILLVFNDEKLIAHLSDEDLLKIHLSLWDNYFEVWNIEEALNSYKEAYKLWDLYIIKEIIYLTIYLDIAWKDAQTLKDYTFSNIINTIERDKNDHTFLKQLESDLEWFFVWGLDYIKDADTKWSYIYNLEVNEEKFNRSLFYLEQNLSNDDYIKIINERKDYYTNMYLGLWNWFSEANNQECFLEENLETIDEAREWMSIRMQWIDVEYLKYWKYLKDFIETGFQIIDTYMRNNDNEKVWSMLSFITSIWFENLWYTHKEFILNQLYIIVNKDIPDEYKIIINKVLYDNVLSSELSYNSIILVWDILLKLNDYKQASVFYVSVLWEFPNTILKIKELLEYILMNSDFDISTNNNQRMNPELIISLLIEKIDNRVIFKKSDYDNLGYVCSL